MDEHHVTTGQADQSRRSMIGWGALAPLAVIGTLSATSFATKGMASMSDSETPRSDRRREAEAFLRTLQEDGLLAAIERCMSEDVDFFIISETSPELSSILPWMGRHTGREAALAYAVRLQRNQENLAFVVDRLVAEKDEVVAFASVTARVNSTGEQATWDLVFSMRFNAQGQIARYHLIENSYEPARLRRLSGSWSIEADGVTQTVPSKT